MQGDRKKMSGPRGTQGDTQQGREERARRSAGVGRGGTLSGLKETCPSARSGPWGSRGMIRRL